MTKSAAARSAVLPLSLPPRGLSREQAAAYCGVSAATFDTLISQGKMPKPKRFLSRKIWDRHEIDRAFDALDGGGIDEPEERNEASNPWDAMS